MGLVQMEKQEKKYEIYKITNKINGKIYIGITSNGYINRWKQHCTRALCKKEHKKSKFHLAILKYGKEVFNVELIKTAYTYKEASYLERFYIKKYDSFEQGYNGDLGGYLRFISEDEKERISKKLKGHKVSEETKERIRRARAKQVIKKWSDEAKKKASETWKEYFKTHQGNRVGQKNSPEHRKRISESLKGRRPSDKCIENSIKAHKGKHLSEEHKRKIRENSVYHYKKIICLELNKKFDSINEAAEFLHVKKCGIYAALQKRSETSHGYHWKYL